MTKILSFSAGGGTGWPSPLMLAVVWARRPPWRARQGCWNQALNESKSHLDIFLWHNPYQRRPSHGSVAQVNWAKKVTYMQLALPLLLRSERTIGRRSFQEEEKGVCSLLFGVNVCTRKGDAAPLITVARHTNSSRPDRLNISPLSLCQQHWLCPQPDMYSMHSQASELTSSSKIVWL